MTDARIVSRAPDGSGLTHSLLDDLYEKRHKGMPLDAIPVVGLLKVAGSGEQDTAKGGKRHVKLEFLRLEPVRDPHDAEQIAWQITRADDSRHAPTGQGELPLSNSPAEKRRSILEEVHEWGQEHDHTEEQLDDNWLAYFGGPDYAAAEHYRDGSLVQLLEWSGYLTQEKQTAIPVPEFSDSSEPEDDE